MSVLTEPRAAERRAEPAAARDVSFWGGMRRGIGWCIAAVVIAVALAVVVVPRLVDAVPLTILSGSMQPLYRPGDMVISQRTTPDLIEVGDVVTFQPVSGNPILITHRVIAKTVGDAGIGFITRGDANGAADEPIAGEQVRGRVLYAVPLVGHLTRAIPDAARGPLIATLGIGLLAWGAASLLRRPRTTPTPSLSPQQQRTRS